MRPKDGTIDEETNQIYWPKTCPVSFEFMDEDGLYLITTGVEIYLVWGDSLSDDVMSEVFCGDGNGNFMLIEDHPEDSQSTGRKVTRLIDEIR